MRARVLGALIAGLAAASASAQVPAGGPFRVNTYTTSDQQSPRFSTLPNGDSVAVWTSRQQANSIFALFSQRYQADGTPLGGEFRVDSGDFAGLSAVAQSDNTGRFMIVWHDGTGVSNFDIHGRRFSANGAPRGAEFMVNTSTTGNEYRPDIAPLFGGGFVVVWSQNYSYTQNRPARILAQRYDGFGVPVGAETVVNIVTSGTSEIFPRVAATVDGRFVVTWLHSSAASSGIRARVFDAAGNPTGLPVSVPSAPQGADAFPGVAIQQDGGFVVAWQSGQVVGGASDVVARRFAPGGAPIGAQFAVSSSGPANRSYPVVGADARGDFVIAWSSGTAPNTTVVGRRFDLTGAPRGGDFPVSVNATGLASPSDIAVDTSGNFVVSWTATGQDGSGYAAMARRFGGLIPSPMTVDTAATATSDGNGVLEPGEVADVRPSWRNVNGGAQSFTGTIPQFFGPPATYTIADGGASYGTVANGTTGACLSSDCYALGVSAPPVRPVQHWDGFFYEDLAPDTLGHRKTWRLHVGDTFTDVPRSSIYYRFIETLIHNFITAGCTNTSYCPQTPTTREQMAVFVLVARDAAGDAPPVCTTPLFTDVPASSGYCRWIEELARSGVVSGCGNGAFCPQAPVSREQMSVFMLRTLDGTLDPPPCTTPIFSDVPASSPYCRWIEELARRGIVTGCGGGNFCPTATVTREQMAVFISGTFGLKLYGPLP